MEATVHTPVEHSLNLCIQEKHLSIHKYLYWQNDFEINEPFSLSESPI